MTRIDFYILKSDSVKSRLLFACRLADKALKQKNKILILVDSESQAEELDTVLWEFIPESFVPHCRNGDQNAQFPIVISHDTVIDDHHDLLINLQRSPPNQFSRFSRLVEIVIQDATILGATRESYKFYTSRGYPTYTHNL